MQQGAALAGREAHAHKVQCLLQQLCYCRGNHPSRGILAGAIILILLAATWTPLECTLLLAVRGLLSQTSEFLDVFGLT